MRRYPMRAYSVHKYFSKCSATLQLESRRNDSQLFLFALFIFILLLLLQFYFSCALFSFPFIYLLSPWLSPFLPCSRSLSVCLQWVVWCDWMDSHVQFASRIGRAFTRAHCQEGYVCFRSCRRNENISSCIAHSVRSTVKWGNRRRRFRFIRKCLSSILFLLFALSKLTYSHTEAVTERCSSTHTGFDSQATRTRNRLIIKYVLVLNVRIV